MPSGNGLSPVLRAVPNLSISQDETFSFAGASFTTAANLSAWGSLMRYLTLLPSLGEWCGCVIFVYFFVILRDTQTNLLFFFFFFFCFFCPPRIFLTRKA